MISATFSISSSIDWHLEKSCLECASDSSVCNGGSSSSNSSSSSSSSGSGSSSNINSSGRI